MVVQDIASEGFPASGVGRYLGFVLGPDSFAERRAAVRAKFLARAAHVKAFGLYFCGIPFEYNTFVVPVVGYTAKFFPLDESMRSAEHAAIARVFATPMDALTPPTRFSTSARSALGAFHRTSPAWYGRAGSERSSSALSLPWLSIESTPLGSSDGVSTPASAAVWRPIFLRAKLSC